MERALDLSRQGLTTLAQIPRDAVRHVERGGEPYALSLAQNRLSQLGDINIFQHVVQVDVSGNQLQTLDGIQALVHLESLNASRNILTSLDALGALQKLRVVSVAENKLVQIDVLRQLKALIAVDASYNSITKWPQLSHLAAVETIDLSSNLLESFPVSMAVRLFPPSLRRLSLAKNEFQDLCGIAALGMFLPKLQSIKIDANPATQRIVRDGGCLDFLWVNLFANVSFAKGSGVRRDDFVVPTETIDAVEDVVERGDEATLNQFLLRGTVRLGGPRSEISYQPPQRIRDAPHEPISLGSPRLRAGNRFRMDSTTHQTALSTPTPDLSDSGSTVGLSKESKMELWKRMMDERKAQEQRDKSQHALTSTAQHPPAVPPPPPIMQHKPVPSFGPEVKTRAPELVQPPPPLPPSDRAVSKTLAPQANTTPSEDALAEQVRALNGQLMSIRKYVKVWIKREQLTRDAAAKRIQKYTRRRRWLLQLSASIRQSRARRRAEYSVEPCSSELVGSVPPSQMHFHLYAISIQRHIRGWLCRNRVSRWMYYSDAARRIQRGWRRRRGEREETKRELGLRGQPAKHVQQSLINAVVSLATDVRQLQRVFVVQEQALARQWRDLARYRSFVERALTAPVVKLQSLWRGYVARKRLARPQQSPGHLAARDSEIARLRADLDALKAVVERLVEKS